MSLKDNENAELKLHNERILSEKDKLEKELKDVVESMLNIIGVTRFVSPKAYDCILPEFINRLHEIDKRSKGAEDE